MTKINEKGQAPVSLKNINTLRTQANDIIASGSAADRNAAKLIKNNLDDYLDSLDASSIITKPSKEATVQESVDSLKQGIDAWKYCFIPGR
jgi:acyl carrier protein